MKKNEWNLGEMWYIIKHSRIRIMRVPKKNGERKEQKNIFEQMVKYSSN